MKGIRDDAFAERIYDALEVEEGDTLFIEYDHPGFPLARRVEDIAEDDGIETAYSSVSSDVNAALYIRAPRTNRNGDFITKGQSDYQTTSFDRASDFTPLITTYPTDYLADLAGMEEDAFEDFFYQAVMAEPDYLLANVLQQRIDAGETVRIEADGTEIELGIGEEEYCRSAAIIGAGKRNIPCGEVFTSPDPRRVNGVITFDSYVMKDGIEYENIQLRYDDGELVDFDADQGYEELVERFEENEDNSRIGEIGIGTNEFIDRLTGNLVFDEKVQRTVHLALGRNFSQAFQPVVDDLREEYDGDDFDELVRDANVSQLVGSDMELVEQAGPELAAELKHRMGRYRDERKDRVNADATFHLDVIKDLRDGGTLLIDDEPVLHDGEFVV